MITIKRLEFEDLKPIIYIRNQYLKYLRQYKPLNIAEQYKWYENTRDIYFSIFYEHKNDPIGAVGLTSLDYINRKAEISLITENYLIKEYADAGMDFIEELAFNKLNMHKLYITVYSFDDKKNEYFIDRYIREYTIRDDVYYGGEYYGHHYYSLLDKEYFERVKK